jgi:hypothetical protein
LLERGLRQPDWTTVEFLVLPSVLELLVDPPTDTNSQLVGCHSHVAEIEEGVQVGSQQEPVRDFVAADKVVASFDGVIRSDNLPEKGDA